MAITFSLPQTLETDLRRQVEDLDQAAKEALVVELFRQGRLTHAQVAETLGLSRFETDAVLKRHGVYDSTTLEDVRRDAAASRQARGE